MRKWRPGRAGFVLNTEPLLIFLGRHAGSLPKYHPKTVRALIAKLFRDFFQPLPRLAALVADAQSGRDRLNRFAALEPDLQVERLLLHQMMQGQSLPSAMPPVENPPAVAVLILIKPCSNDGQGMVRPMSIIGAAQDVELLTSTNSYRISASERKGT